MGTMDYELIKYEPPLTPEHVAKWQIRPTPTPLILREMWTKRDYVKEAEPFQRVPWDEKPEISEYEAGDRTPFLKKLPVREWADAVEGPDAERPRWRTFSPPARLTLSAPGSQDC